MAGIEQSGRMARKVQEYSLATSFTSRDTQSDTISRTVLDAVNPDSPSILPRKTIEDLPNELITQIFGYLETPPPSASRLVDEPVFNITHAEVANLKAASLVSTRWRVAILPKLFKHTRFNVPRLQIPHDLASLDKTINGFLEFVIEKSLTKVIASFALLVGHKIYGGSWPGMYALNAVDSFWKLLFRTIDPLDLLIVAAPADLGVLTDCYISLAESWTFDAPYHYLHLQQPLKKIFTNNESVTNINTTENPISEIATQPATSMQTNGNTVESNDTPSGMPLEEWDIPRAEYSTLFKIRAWNSLLLNEGSFIKSYSVYEFWLRRPPSILSELVGHEDNPHGAYISPSIRDMSYIGIFPTASHFSAITQTFPRLDRLYVQLVPRNDVLDDTEKMVQVEVEDLWMERNNCYALIMAELSNAPPAGNFKYLKVFESGDAADTVAWKMAVEYIKRAGNGWQVERDGVFIRKTPDLQSDAANDMVGEGSAFQGSLVKWAWNGIMMLPVPAYPLYDLPMGASA